MISELLEKYKEQKPMDLGKAVERTYPVSAIIDMMIEFAQHKTNEQAKAIDEWLMTNTNLDVEKVVDLKQFLANM
jgi:hypothetical protein